MVGVSREEVLERLTIEVRRCFCEGRQIHLEHVINLFSIHDFEGRGSHVGDIRDNSNNGVGGRDRDQEADKEQYGFIISLREVFGFLQPLNVNADAVSTDEHVYFPDREVTYRKVTVGDEVFYGSRITPKGVQAVNVRRIDPSTKVTSGIVNGTITKEYDIHRFTPGLIEVATVPPQFVPFINEDCVVGSSSGKSSPRNSVVRIGDEVELKVMIIPNTCYIRASAVKCLKSAREKQMNEQVKRMLDAGALREQGIIDTLKSSEGYGFIKPADRTGQLFFRLDDFIDLDAKDSLKESVEVDFFVLAENSKGKMTDRAVHIRILPPGTVVLESAVATKTTATVILEPKLHPREEPGVVLLDQPIIRDGLPDINEVELWPRCVPEGLIFRVGDKIELDVQNYRPEKINFARSVKVLSFRKLGREQGRVCSIKKDSGFGFLHSSERHIDVYFRLNEVLGPNGELIQESNITMNLAISFEGVMEETRGGPPRIKAVRCRLLSDSLNISSLLESSGGVGGMTLGADAVSLLKTNCTGVVVRDSNKRDAPGLIKLINGDSGSSSAAEPVALNSATTALHKAEMADAVDEFVLLKQWKEMTLENLNAARRKALHSLLNEAQYSGIAHETILPTGSKNGGVTKFKLWKLGTAEYSKWKANHTPIEDVDSSSVQGKDSPRSNERSNNNSSNASKLIDESDGISFVRSDTSEEFGALAKDLKVSFDMYFDQMTNKKIAKNVRLTDELIASEGGELCGVLDSVFSRGGRFGYIRVIPTDEKLFWHSSGVYLNHDETKLNEGVEVLFSVRRRGGIRIAVDVRCASPSESRSREEVLEGFCTGVVAEDMNVVLIDVDQCPLLRRKYWNFDRVKELAAGASSSSSMVSDEASASDAADIKYLPSITRSAIPLDSSSLGYAKENLLLGDLVQFNCVVNFFKQRQPLRLCNVTKLPVPNIGPKRKGTILRQPVRLRGANVAAMAAAGESVEFSEIRDDVVGSEQAGGAYFFCECREIRCFSDSNKESIQQGDEVEFFALPARGVALHAQVVPRLQELDGVS